MTKRSMTCCICGEGCGRWEQHWNRDTEYGICMDCVEDEKKRGVTPERMENLYGTEGVNYGIPSIG